MSEQETYYAIALTRMTGFNLATALRLYRELGSAEAVYEHRNDIREVLPECTPRLAAALSNWTEALPRAAAEMEFVQRHGIRVLTLGDDDYPQRLSECDDAPLLLYYKGTCDVNRPYVVSIVGTRHATSYGKDLIARFVGDLRQMVPDVLIVSGLAYGVDICAHRNALEQGLDTVAVVAHGLDQIYPQHHRDDARRMISQGGLLTEYMSATVIDKSNFVRRNRIVAGMADATVLVESAAKGGGLITCGIARGYNRSVFAFPGSVGMAYSEGCNNLIRDNGAALITSAQDFVQMMGWQKQMAAEMSATVERQLFPQLSADEQKVVTFLQHTNDVQLSLLSVRTNIPVGQLTALLFQLEMKGLVRTMAGGSYHLLG